MKRSCAEFGGYCLGGIWRAARASGAQEKIVNRITVALAFVAPASASEASALIVPNGPLACAHEIGALQRDAKCADRGGDRPVHPDQVRTSGSLFEGPVSPTMRCRKPGRGRRRARRG